MKKIILFIISLISFVAFNSSVYAANYYEISAPSSAAVETDYTVKVTYRGSDKIGSLTMDVSIVNAECKVSSTYSGGVANCSGGVCQAVYTSTDGIGGGTSLLTLSCKSRTNSSATFRVSTGRDELGEFDSWDVEGTSEISINSANKSVKITGTPTTRKTTTTTKSTAPYRTTTSRKKKTTTTTRNSTVTTKSTTRSTGITIKNPTTIPTSRNNEPTKESTTNSSKTTLKIDLTTAETQKKTEEKHDDDEKYSTIAYVPEDLKLTDLKIVGYDINFQPNRINYTIEVDEKVKELYVIAERENEDIIVNNVGVVNIDGEKEFVISVSSDKVEEEIEYKIRIKTKNYNGVSIKMILIIIGGGILLLIIFRILKEIHKVKKETKTIVSANDAIVPITPETLDNGEVKPKQEGVNLENELTPIALSKITLNSKLGNNEELVSDEVKQEVDAKDEQWLTQNDQPIEPTNLSSEDVNANNPLVNVDDLFANVDNFYDETSH